MPLESKAIKTFSGSNEKGAETINFWLRNIERIAARWNWSDSLQQKIIEMKLTDKAEKWLTGFPHPELVHSLKGLKEQLRKRFGGNLTDPIIRDEIRNRKFKLNTESYDDYSLDITILFSQLSRTYEDSDVINALIDGFPFEIYDHFDKNRYRYTDLQQFETEVVQYLNNRSKRIARESRRRKQLNQISEQPTPRRNNLGTPATPSTSGLNNRNFSTPQQENSDPRPSNSDCSNGYQRFNSQCNLTTPFKPRFNNNNFSNSNSSSKSFETPKPNKNSEIPKTPKKTFNPSQINSNNSPFKPSRTVNTMTDDADEIEFENEPVINVSLYQPLTLPILVNEKTVNALIDTGASLSVISADIPVNTGCLLPTSYSVALSNGSKLPVQHNALVEISMAGITKNVQVAFIEKFPYQALIGTDLIHNFGLVINARDSTISTQDNTPEACHMHEKSELDEEIRLISAESLLILPNSIQAVKVKPNIFKNAKTPYVFDTLQPFSHNRDVIVPRAVLSFNNEKIAHIIFMNTTDKPFKLSKNHYIGDIQRVDSDIINITELHEEEKPANFIMPDLSHLDDKRQQRLATLIKKYGHLMVEPQDYDSNIKTEHVIDLIGPMPKKAQLRRTSPEQRLIIDQHIDKMLQKGVIERSNSPYAFPIVLVRKKDGSMRFCIDYRLLNLVTCLDAYPLPRIEDVFDAFFGAVIFSVVDMKDAYFHVKIRPSDRELTAFISHRGLFQFVNMAFGFSNAPATWQSSADEMFSDYLWIFCLVYMDDLIIYSKDFDSHMEHLEKVFQRLSNYKVHLNPKKCHFAQESVEYLGHTVSKNGISPNPNKVKAILNMPAPTTLKEVRSFTGLAGYYRRFIPNFAAIGEPLYKLTRKNATFNWSTDCQQAFESLKQTLAILPVLAFPNWEKEFIIHTDASGYGIGAILSQLDDANEERPIAYWSRTLNAAERNYHTTEQECLALIEALKQFRTYLQSNPFTIYTDHAALQWLMTKKEPAGRLARWSLDIQHYVNRMKIIHRSGDKNQNADGLSRLPVINVTAKVPPEQQNAMQKLAKEYLEKFSADPKKFSEIQQLDPAYGPIIDYLRSGTLPDNKKKRDEVVAISDHFELIDDLLFHLWYPGGTRRIQRTRFQLCIPLTLQHAIIQACHDKIEGSHFGVTRTYEKVRDHYYWPSMHRDIKKYVQACTPCQLKKKSRQAPAGLLIPITASAPFKIIGVDIIGPLPLTFNKNQFILVFTDYLTRWVEAFPMKKITAEAVAELYVREVVTRHGAPKKILSDRGKQFLSKLSLAIFSYLGSTKLSTTPYCPQTDGLTERFNHTLISAISMYVSDHQRDWDQLIPYALLAYRTSHHASSGLTPFQLLYRREAYLPLDRIMPTGEEIDSFTPDQWSQELHERLQEAYATAAAANQLAKEAQQRNYDKKRRDISFEENEEVLWYNPKIIPGKVQKLAKPFEGPYIISEKKNDNVYVIKNATGSEHVVNIERLKKYHQPIVPTLSIPTIQPVSNALQPEEDLQREELAAEISEDSYEPFNVDLKPIYDEDIPEKLRPAFDAILYQLQQLDNNENHPIASAKKVLVNAFSSPIIDSSTLSKQLRNQLAKIKTRTELQQFLDLLIRDFNNQFALEIHRSQSNKGGM